MTIVEEASGHQTGLVNASFSHDDGNRKVSISSDAPTDIERRRTISSGSHRKEFGHCPPANSHYYAQNHPSQEEHWDYFTQADMSLWFVLCTKCRQKETGPGWEPRYWQSVCPYPFCPTYRHMARFFTLVLLVMLSWGIIYSVVGSDAAPGGQLFNIAVLVIVSYFGGYIIRLFNIPGLVGMLFVGMIFANLGLIEIQGSYKYMCAVLRKTALVVILTRAGMDLDPTAMKRLFFTILKLSLVPWLGEAGVVAVMSHFLLDLPWMWSLLIGGLSAAVAPAVVVACLFRLRSKGYGVAKGIPTVVIAVSGIDDAASVAAFGIIQSLIFSSNSFAYNLALGPVAVFGGIGYGILWGLLSKFVPEKGDPFAVPMRIMMLLGGGLIAVFGSELINLEGAGPLAVVAAAFVSSWVWSTQGWDIEDNPVATAFEIFWMIFEPILFSLTGLQIKIAEIDPEVFKSVILIIIVALILRIVFTVLVAFGDSLNLKEKFFLSLSWMAKASVQAALAPAALDAVNKHGLNHGPEQRYAEVLLMFCVLCILVTAPLGAIVITLSGPRLLTKTVPGPPSAWRHSSRLSLRDITIVDEGKESDDIERRMSHHRRSLHWTPTPHLPSSTVHTYA